MSNSILASALVDHAIKCILHKGHGDSFIIHKLEYYY